MAIDGLVSKWNQATSKHTVIDVCCWLRICPQSVMAREGQLYFIKFQTCLVLPEYSCLSSRLVNSLASGEFEWNFRYVIFKHIFVIDGWGFSCEIALICHWTDDQSTLVQIMACCRQMRHLLWNCPNINVTGLHWWSVNIGAGNGLLPDGTKPLPAPMLTQISVAIWCQ